jgi:hypothetical protein
MKWPAFWICLVVAAAALAIELPAAPTGYSWREIPEIKAAFLVPNGWNFLQERRGGALALFITEKPFSPPAEFETGLTINVFRDDPSAPARLKATLDKMVATHSARLSSGAFGPFAMLSSEFDSPREGGKEPIRTFVLGIANPETKTTYLVMFESPVSLWPAAWSKGKPIVEMLALESEI